MSAREELLRHLWKEVININLRDASLDNTLGTAGAIRRVPSETRGPAIERILAAGASRREVSLVMRSAAYEAAFGTLYALSEPGSDPDDDVSTLYEELLMAEPSGTGGRPGSADAVGWGNR